MKIIDLLDDRSILLDGRVADKKAALDQMVELMDASGKLRDKETYRQGVYAREQEGSTGIGEGIAIPHCKSDAVIKPGLAAMVVKDVFACNLFGSDHICHIIMSGTFAM